MTVPCFTQTQFFGYLKEKGWDIVCDDYWEEYNRIIFCKDGVEMPVQVLPNGSKYFYPVVVTTCQLMGIDPPEDHLICFNQHRQMKSK